MTSCSRDIRSWEPRRTCRSSSSPYPIDLGGGKEKNIYGRGEATKQNSSITIPGVEQAEVLIYPFVYCMFFCISTGDHVVFLLRAIGGKNLEPFLKLPLRWLSRRQAVVMSVFFFKETKRNEMKPNKNSCILLLFTVDYVHICPGEWLTTAGSGGVSISGDPEVNPQLFRVFFFKSTADVMLLSQHKTKQNKSKIEQPNATHSTATKPASIDQHIDTHAQVTAVMYHGARWCTWWCPSWTTEAKRQKQKSSEETTIHAELTNQHLPWVRACCMPVLSH